MTFNKRTISILLYGSALAILLVLLKYLEWNLVVGDYSHEIYAGVLAVLFTLLGIWLSVKLTVPKIHTIIVNKEILFKGKPFILNEAEIKRLGLSKREMEVLSLMADNLSNNEIATRLFLSLNTIKTHVSRILEKMEVKRRALAIEKAKKLQLIP